MIKSSFFTIVLIVLVALIIYLIGTGAKAFIIMPTVIFTIVACALLARFGKCNKDVVIEEERKQQTLQDLITTYGTPDEIIVTDATRGNEIDGVVLAYNKGEAMAKGFHLQWNCYRQGKHHQHHLQQQFRHRLRLARRIPNGSHNQRKKHRKVYFLAGNDINMAKDIITQMKSYLQPCP